MAEEKGQVGGKTGEKTEGEKRAELNPKGVLLRVGSETFWLRQKPRSVFQKRRVLVKTMILNSILQFLGFSSSAEAPEAKAHDCFFNKEMYSYPLELANASNGK
ncbi:hypothetical protein TIFTF001_019513 [Ficus carica]|uniref:Uncharacterized protein n=1 Tax=Ficus carica TaxID=3494 RepID=A0AA88AEG9_FICCA|nr:hypothetical protein TIFTF001_019513 [Ficus carica]